MEARGKLGDILVDAAGVIVARGKADFLGKQRDQIGRASCRERV